MSFYLDQTINEFNLNGKFWEFIGNPSNLESQSVVAVKYLLENQSIIQNATEGCNIRTKIDLNY